jgi:hypothetical protein
VPFVTSATKDRHRILGTGHERYIHKPPTLEDFLEEVGEAIEELLAKRRNCQILCVR